MILNKGNNQAIDCMMSEAKEITASSCLRQIPDRRIVLLQASEQLASGKRTFAIPGQPVLSFLSSSLTRNLLCCSVLVQNTYSIKAHDCPDSRGLSLALSPPMHHAFLNGWGEDW